jgi:S-DNA-T family DNA segregation ATPase FtsK/SpoIIIE
VTNRSKEQAAAAEPSVWEQRLREAAVLLLIPMIVYLGVCLYTYFPGDPGWSHAGSDTPVRNLGGSVGAWIADLSLYFFGGMAFAFPLMLAAIAWRLIRDESALPGTKHDSAWLLLGAAGWIASGAGLAHLHFFETASPLPANAGGVVGALFGDLLRSAAGELGATLFLFAIFLVMLTLFTGISWFRLMEAIGGAVLNAIAKLRAFWEGREERRAVREVREEREEIRKVEKVKQAKREPLKIEQPTPMVEKSERAERELQIPLFTSLPAGELPPLSLLDDPKPQPKGYSEETLETLSRQVEFKLRDFKIDAQVVGAYPGPVITRFEMQPAPGVKGRQISNLDKDIARGL